jgi:predicted house-cleaning NTP pyrophosphatase (Maf/HAM1 superfamily)
MWSQFLLGCFQTRQGSQFTQPISQFSLFNKRTVNKKIVKPSPVYVCAAMVEGEKDANKTVWLGSGSSTRQALMRQLVEEHGILFGGKVSADIDEKAIRRSDPRELVLALAHAKADAILSGDGGLTHGYLITCDQVVVHQGSILEKPESEEEARKMIAGYSRAPASTVGSTVVTRVETGDRVEHVDVATVRAVM